MAEDVLKVPVLKLEIPKPRRWDFIALAVMMVGIGAAAMNIMGSGLAGSGASASRRRS